jgi:hypothetical protein
MEQENTMTNATWNGLSCVSLRDEPWEEAQETIRKAFKAGYRFVVIDDSFMLFNAPVPLGDEEITVAAFVDASNDTEEALLAYAAEEWWR